MSFAAVAVGIAGVAGAAISASAAGSAANTQAAYENSALGFQENAYNTTLNNEYPFVNAGAGAQSQLNYLLGIGKPGDTGTGQGSYGPVASSSPAGGFGSLNTPFSADMMKQFSPAYQFQMQQGQQGVLNSDASGQGALSGAALKDLTSFNQNYANTAFNNAFNQYQTQQNSVFNRLAGVSQLGQAAASNQASGGSNYANSIGNTAGSIGASLAAGQVGQANAISGGLQSLGSLPWLTANTGGGGNSWGSINDSVQQGSNTWNSGFNPDIEGMPVG